MNLDPLDVRVIDFNAVFLDSTESKGTARGTPGYMPMATKWRDSSYKWDKWALVAMIAEADMERDYYLHTNFEDDAKKKFKDHLKLKTTCNHLKTLIEGVIFKKREEEMIDFEEIKTLVSKIKF